MKYKIDLHVHTIGSNHAYSTIEEIAKRANEKGLDAIAMTDHGPGAPDGPHRYYFSNLKVIPDVIDGVRILKGIEANIISEKGELDLDDSDLKKMEIVLAGFHKLTKYGESDVTKNTNALINAIRSEKIDILAHIGNPEYPIDYEKVIEAATLHNVAIEINNSSFLFSRVGSKENCREIVMIAKQYNTMVSLGSDAHISFQVGELEKAEKLLEEAGYKEELIINSSMEILQKFLKNRRVRLK